MPAYVFGSQEDHIVPWRTAYASTAILGGPLRFVLGASGHIAGVINPPAKNRRSFWTHAQTHYRDDMPRDPEVWLQSATSRQGSWWPDWSDWQSAHSGTRRAAKLKPGNARYRPIEPAPGRYVMVRAV
jgi:polyhydroxyalkanoate synthase